MRSYTQVGNSVSPRIQVFHRTGAEQGVAQGFRAALFSQRI